MENEKKEKPDVLDISSLDTYILVKLFINILSMQAWQHMGLRVKAGTDQIEKDFDRAQVAIDCIEFLIGKLENHIEENEKDKLRSLLRDLQMNFVRLKT